MRKSKTKDSKYPEDDRDLKVYEDWEAGPAHYDFRNKKRFDNRSVREREGYRHPTLPALLLLSEGRKTSGIVICIAFQIPSECRASDGQNRSVPSARL